MLRVGRTLAYALARRYEDTAGLEGLPVVRLGNCLRVPRWALLELALNGRTVPLGELTPGADDARRALDAELTRINQLGREADPEPEQNAPRIAQLSGRARLRRAVRTRSGEQLHLLPRVLHRVVQVRADKCPRASGTFRGTVLRVTTLHASSAAATARYYAEYLTAAPGEVPGEWAGHQADGLGLSGDVSVEQLEAFAVGPVTP